MGYSNTGKKYSYFIIAVIACIIIISLPMLYGHFFHSGHLLYVAIHESGFILASFLTVMTMITYKKTKIRRMLFSSAGFGILAFGQGEIMYQQMNNNVADELTSSGEVLEYCIVAMMILFAVGIFYRR
ncbi:MAG: hypothetical protein H8E89_05625 [Candidatus Nitrosopelagicus sp.]|nr:hypothetical protein [Candidatus Nitrosopelagicus sp.]